MSRFENYRLELQILNQRIENLTNIIHATNGFTLAFFAVILTIFTDIVLNKTLEKNMLYSLIAFISIFELCSWRLYANYVDFSIVECYEKIVAYQNKLCYLPELSLENSLKLNDLHDRGHTFLDGFSLIIISAIEFFFYKIANPLKYPFIGFDDISKSLFFINIIALAISITIIVHFKGDKKGDKNLKINTIVSNRGKFLQKKII